MTIKQPQLSLLAQELPPLLFDGEQDLLWPKTALPELYLRSYNLDFAGEFPGLRHGFGRIEAAGFVIATHYWLPIKPRATLVIVHGYYDHVGIFDKAIRFALQQNFAVLAFDLPGHGLSSGAQAAIDSFDQYGDVLHEVLMHASKLLPQPWHALGQSTGASVLLNYLLRYEATAAAPAMLNKIALFAPLILPRGWGVGRLLYSVARFFMQRIQRGPSRSSHDSEFTRFIEREDALQAKYLSLKWVAAMAQWHKFFMHAPPLQRSVLVVQGTGDKTVAWRYNLTQLRKKIPAVEVHLIPDAGHQLINESPLYREQLLTIVRAWFTS